MRALLLVVVFCLFAGCNPGDDSVVQAGAAVGSACWEPCPRPVLEVDHEVVDRIANWLSIDRARARSRRVSVSSLLHDLLLRGPEARIRISKEDESITVLDGILDDRYSRQLFGSRVLAVTRHGIRLNAPTSAYRRKGARAESHFNQGLAEMALRGVPLDAVIRIGAESYSVQAMLDDAIAEFQPSRSELAWTAMALAVYLPPQPSWSNRYGEKCSFDVLVERLMRQRWSELSCGGTHKMAALIAIMNSDRLSPILSPSRRRGLAEYVAGLVETITKRQLPDGSWSWTWHTEADPEEEGAMIVTAHILEALLRMPQGQGLSDEMFRRAGAWLQRQLGKVQEGDRRVKRCPLTHAVWVVRTLASNS